MAAKVLEAVINNNLSVDNVLEWLSKNYSINKVSFLFFKLFNKRRRRHVESRKFIQFERYKRIARDCGKFGDNRHENITIG